MTGSISRLALILVVVALNHVSYGQYDPDQRLDLSVGAGVPFGKEMTNVYTVGGIASLGYSIPVLKSRFRVVPTVAYNRYLNHYDETTRDDLSFWNLGSKFELNSKVGDKTQVVPFLGAYYLIGEDHLTPRKGFSGSDATLYTLRGVGFNIGARVQFKSNVTVTFQCDLVTPEGTLGSVVKSNLLQQFGAANSLYNVIDIHKIHPSFNNFSIALGYRFNLHANH